MEAIEHATRTKKLRLKRGYEKLAFGKTNDAVLLLFQNGLTPEELKKLDLTCLSGIRKVKDTVELCFYDRLKALDCLRALENDEEEKSPLYRALMESVAKTEGGDRDGV